MTSSVPTQAAIAGMGVFLSIYFLWKGWELIPWEQKQKNNPKKGLRRLKRKINHSNHLFYMVSDCGCSTIFNEISLGQALRKASERKVDVKFILLRPKIYHNGEGKSPLLELARQEKLGLAIAPESSREEFKNHFQVSDISLYIEDPHPSYGEENYSGSRSGVFKRNKPRVAREYTDKFLDLWEKSDKFHPGYEPAFEFLSVRS